MTYASRRFNRLGKYAFSSILAFGSFCALTQAARAADPEKVTIMVGGITKLIYLPARLTEQLGYFKTEGLDVELLSQPAGGDEENQLSAGAVQAVDGVSNHS